jgi:hypothetical protein
VVAVAATAIVFVPSVREPILRAAGRVLVVNEPIAPSDVIVVSLDSAGAGALEAADLVKRGIATRVAVFTDPPSGEEDYEFIRRGLPYDDASARQIRQLRELGVVISYKFLKPAMEPKPKPRCLRHGVTSNGSDRSCLLPLGTTRDEHGSCSIES